MPASVLTDAAVRALASHDGARFEISDAKCRGLRLRVSPKGKNWSVMLRVGGIVERVTLGPYPDVSLREARDKALAFRLKRAEGRSPAKEAREGKKADAAAKLKADDLVERYLAKKSSMKSVAQLRGFLKPFRQQYGDRPSVSIGRNEVISWLEHLAAFSPVSANRQLAAIRAMFNWAIDRELLEKNPLDRVRRVAAEQSRERVLSKKELKALWHATGDKTLSLTPEAAGAAMRLILLTACRPGEIVGLRMGEIHLDDEYPHIALPRNRTKSGESRRVPLSSLAIEVVRDRLTQLEEADTHFLFPMVGNLHRSASRWFVAQAVVRLRGRLGEGADWTAHDLRRTAATLAGEAGTRGEDIGALLGHTDGSVTAVYARHDRAPALRRAVEGIEAAIRKAAALRG